MPIKEIRDIKDQINLMTKQLNDWKKFFTDGNECLLDDDDRTTKCAAYQTGYNTVIETETDGKYKYKYGGTVKDIFLKLNFMRVSGEFFINQLVFIENKIKESLKNTNNDIKGDKKSYDDADLFYELNNNINAATGILKIDSYDRNIEENFYIMYYLLSYGVLGFFIYKLLKL